MHPHDNAEALLRVLSAPRRNRYFYGKRMDVAHFQMEQGYGKLKQWLLNRLTVGKGVLCGLKVTVDGMRVCIDPGVAIDGLGREIVVPVRTCLDPLARDDGCCGSTPMAPEPAPGASDDRLQLYTLWVCYRECLADHEPVLVSTCETREPCAAGTTVETFCFKVTPGLAEPLGDPAWCARLWGRPDDPPQPAPQPGSGDLANPAPAPNGGSIRPADEWLTAPVADPAASDGGGNLDDADRNAIRDALRSRRHLLCELFDTDCDPAEADACVPLAVIAKVGDRLQVETCLVRPRLYSNETLLELILCLADKVDECCKGHEPTAQPMRVRSVDFVRRSIGAAEQAVARIESPLDATAVDIGGGTNTIRIRFDQPFAQDQHKPTTHALGDADFEHHNVQVLPARPVNDLPFVPGTLVIEAPDTVRFDLFADSPYSRGGDGWQKGRYRIFLRGNEDLPNGRQALADSATLAAFDGEPIAPAAGVISGNGAAGGDFSVEFIVGADAEPAVPMRVRSVEFLERGGDDARLLAPVETPTKVTAVTGRLGAIRIRFDKPFEPGAPAGPTTHGPDDPDFEQHNVQVRLAARDARRLDIRFVPGTLAVEEPDTIRFDVALGTRAVDGNGNWPEGGVRCELFLRGSPGSAAQQQPLTDTDGAALDGEPKPPADGVISGDGAAGGDFTAPFSVRNET